MMCGCSLPWVQEEYRDEFGDLAFEPRVAVRNEVQRILERRAPAPRPEPRSESPFEPRVGPSAMYRSFNGNWLVIIEAHSNHRQNWPVEVFTDVAAVAPASFGFLHVHDDEHATESEMFGRWTMVHGDVTAQEDETLRPVVARWFEPYSES